ncbi:hypothetical protein M438DRAFT_69578 [Aureobasidium pullulans EXF-150]|uniref:Uncharacterized protein n=1 Tax=Aureobasidium pullulans EXF-150 TaxID=1043002 RepID=A0A074XDE5_AURPU|nr:uncharacterized protein M438DRAFT_69578 [Aureobasidium pullulans EXF-150]KEQ81734.1 hypothetical protein M438DRAFT_69578 [Aureobasidium pullulans EXF-150]
MRNEARVIHDMWHFQEMNTTVSFSFLGCRWTADPEAMLQPMKTRSRQRNSSFGAANVDSRQPSRLTGL